MHRKNTSQGTALGLAAIVIWSLSPTLATLTKGIPLFQLTGSTLGLFFLLTVLRLSWSRSWTSVRAPLKLFLTGCLGITMSDVCYLLGFRFAPPAHVEIINYLWPLLALGLGAWILKIPLTERKKISIFLGFSGVFCLMQPWKHGGLQAEYWLGYLLAFAAALCWSLYSIFSARHPEIPSQITGLYCGVGSLLAWVLHFMFENHYSVTGQEAWAVLSMGIGTTGAAYVCWDFGMKHGDIATLSVSAYLTPVLSVLLLVLLHLSPASPMLWVALSSVVGASLLSHQWK